MYDIFLSVESGTGLLSDRLDLLLVVYPGKASLGKRLGRCHCLVPTRLLAMSVHDSPAKVDHIFVAADGVFLLGHCVALIARDARL